MAVMDRRIEGRPGPAFVALLVMGAAYWLTAMARSGVALQHLSQLPPMLVTGWKFACILGLALLVVLRTSGDIRWMLGGSLLLIAIADLLLATRGLMSGGSFFVLAHLLAIALYCRYRDRNASGAVKLIALAVPVLAVLAVAIAVAAKGLHPVHLFYPAISGSMAACAIGSRFPRWNSGLGASLFVLSDVIFFWDFGFYDGSGALGWLVWLCFFTGVALIALGAIRGPRNVGGLHG